MSIFLCGMCKQNRSTEDATLTLLNNVYPHVEKSDSLARILFVDFSSAFSTIQQHKMALKLMELEVDSNLILWISLDLSLSVLHVHSQIPE